MFINPINSVNRNIVKINSIKKSQFKEQPTVETDPKEVKANSISFYAGPNPTVLRNQYKVLFTENMNLWSKDIMVRLPESAIEKEVLLEILQKRLKLDEYVRLKNERFLLARDEKLSDENYEGREEAVSQLRKIDEAIRLTSEVNRAALQYFKDIAKLADEYQTKKLVKPSQMEKFFVQLRKNNINTEGQYSIAELIEIVKSGEKPVKTEAVESVKKATTPIYHSKKELLAAIEASYEKTLRSVVNVYVPSNNNYEFEVYVARQAVEGKFKESIKKLPDIEKSIKKVYESIEKIYIHKHNILAKFLLPGENKDNCFYNLNIIWEKMKPIEADLKLKIKELNNLKALLEQKPRDKKLLEQIEVKEDEIGELKDKWVYLMLNSVDLETKNYKMFERNGLKEVYNYLVDENPTVQKHFFAFMKRTDNEGVIPDEYWETNILEIKPKKKD